MTDYRIGPPNNSLALASLILGSVAVGVAFLFSLVIYGRTWGGFALLVVLVGVPALLAVIFGFVGISTANRLRGKRKPHAVVGVVFGFTWPLVYLLFSYLWTIW